ncbi:MAG: Hpt domain-containing protein [Bdellovibrionales bacterium]
MEADELDFLMNLKEEFVEEGLEHIDSLEGAALEYEREGDLEVLTGFKRKLHSFKGSAQAVDEDVFAEKLHLLETKLEACIQGQRFDDFMQFIYPLIDKMRDYVNSMENGGDESVLSEIVTLVDSFQ